MTTELETAIDRVVEAIEAPTDQAERYQLCARAEEVIPGTLRATRQRIALALRGEGRTWKAIGEVMGGVSAQRAEQYSRGA